MWVIHMCLTHLCKIYDHSSYKRGTLQTKPRPNWSQCQISSQIFTCLSQQKPQHKVGYRRSHKDSFQYSLSYHHHHCLLRILTQLNSLSVELLQTSTRAFLMLDSNQALWGLLCSHGQIPSPWDTREYSSFDQPV